MQFCCPPFWRLIVIRIYIFQSMTPEKKFDNSYTTNLILLFYVGPRFPDMYPLHIGVLEMREATRPLCTTLYNSNNSGKFLARENKKSKAYLQLMSFIQMTKTTNIYILHENKGCMELHNTLLHNIIILIIFWHCIIQSICPMHSLSTKIFQKTKRVALKTATAFV